MSQPLRDKDTADTAAATGRSLLGMMQKIEHVITDHAPELFPNKLDVDGYEVNECEVLSALVHNWEQKIDRAFNSDNAVGEFTVEEWRELCAASENHLNEQFQFIDALVIPGQRYFDSRPYLKSSLLKQRYSYLQLLWRQIEAEKA